MTLRVVSSDGRSAAGRAVPSTGRDGAGPQSTRSRAVEQRVDGGWADESVRAVWRVSEPVDYPRSDDGGAARYHEPTDMVLIAHYGVLDTVCDLSQDAEHVRQSVREQVGAAGGDSE